MTEKKRSPRRNEIPASGDISYGVEWRDMPEKQRDVRKTRITKIVRELQANPGRSARVARNAKSTSAVSPWRKYGCIAQVRRAEDDKDLYDVYAWWPKQDEPGHGEKDTLD